MADEVERLVIAPFREMVEKANTAVENANDAADHDVAVLMLKAAQSLAKEGERGLKRIEPLCAKQYEEYSSNFIDAIKEHNELGQFRVELEDMLWDFDDYTEVDEFSAQRFEELQKASRKAAPKIVDILKRMKLVAPLQPKSTPDEETSPRTTDGDEDEMSPTVGDVNVVFDEPSCSQRKMDEIEQQLTSMGSQAGPDEGLEGNATNGGIARSNSQRSGTSGRQSEPPPRPPSTDPWQVGLTPPAVPSGEQWRRRPVSLEDSPTLPLVLPVQSSGNETSIRRHSPSLSNGSSSTCWYPVSNSGNDRSRLDSMISPGSSNENEKGVSRHTSQSSGSNNHSPKFGYTTNTIHSPRKTSSRNTQNDALRHPSTDSFNSSIFDCVPYDGASSPVASTQRTSSVTSNPTSPYSPTTTTHQQRNSLPPQYPGLPPIYHDQSPESPSVTGTIVNQSCSTLTTIPQSPQPAPPPPLVYDDGIIPVDSETPENGPMPGRQPDCTIGPRSSFYQMKGFCKGAEEAARGELGFKKIKRPVGGFSMAIVAKCSHCLFELDYKSVEQDLKNDSSGNFSSYGVDFRLRVLQKSHLKGNHVEEQLYGCIFCIHAGRTIDESDATVFFSQKQLFAHLARHPRPLPAIPGFSIIEGDDTPQHLRDNFDLRFPKPPVQSIMAGIAREVGKLPAAVATEQRKNMNGVLRSPPDRASVLQFAVGARIVGIEFPAKYEGKWGIGWHDGVRAAFEAESVHLDAPPRNEVRMQGTSSMQAVARWRWKQSSEGNWLKFDKGHIIKNISWSYTDHWCWSGTSSKGWGIFPQSHIDHTSLRPVQPGDTASVSNFEKRSALSRFSIHKPARLGSSGPSTPKMSIY